MAGLKRFELKLLFAFGLCIISFLVLAMGVGMVIEDENSSTFTVSSGAENKISVLTGKDFRIKIESNITTGFTWNVKESDELKNDDPVIQYLGKKSEEEHSEEPPMMGSPGFEILKFKALRPGNITIILEYRRPWEKTEKPEKVQKIDITVD